MKKIGLSANFLYPDPSRAVYGPKSLSYAENEMLSWVAGGHHLPIIIPQADSELLERYIDEIDGLVLTGGSDVAPQSYGEEGIMDQAWPGDPMRDRYEFGLLDVAVAKKKPIFGICRGIQVLNAYFGGTLYQDLEFQKTGSKKHRDAVLYDRIHHKVVLVKDQPLVKVYGGLEEIAVNSVHHQGIKDLAPSLVAWGHAVEDGVIEALGHSDFPTTPIMGVQWHPEFKSLGVGVPLTASTPLWQAFIDLC